MHDAASRCRLPVALALGLLSVSVGRVHGQTPPPIYTPNIDLTNASYVRALARLPNGQIIVGSNDLQRADGTALRYLARLNGDGSLDSSWQPAPNGGVSALWVDAVGTLYVGGYFSSIAGQPRAGLARFTAAGQLDANWQPALNGGVNAIAPGLAGSVCVGGTFTQVNGTGHNRLACVSDVDGSTLASFAPDVNSAVSALVSDGGNLYVGGYFTSISGTTRTYAARLPLSGSGTPDGWNPAPNGVALAFLPAGSGQVYLAGFFGALGATTRAGVAKVNDTTGAVITGWNAQLQGDGALDLCSDGTGGVVVVGSFTQAGGQARLNMADVDGSAGNAVITFNPGIDYGYATKVLAQAGSSYLVAGPFAALGGGEHLALGRVLSDGSVDATFNPVLEAQGYAYVAAALPAPGSFVVGGRFVRANGLIRRNLFKLSLPGIVDPNWIAGTDEEVRALAVDAVGRVYVGGYFNRVDGTAHNYIVRLQNTSDGAVDPAWSAQASYAVYPMLLRPEGLYVAGSSFALSGGGSQSYLARLSTVTGATDTGWKPQLDGFVGDLAADAAGDLLVVGSFSAANGSARAGAAKFATGISATLDASWAPAFAGGSPCCISLDGDSVYVGGSFTSVNSAPRGGLALVSASGSGSLDSLWTPALTATFNNTPAKLLARPEGVYVAGYFNSINGGGNGYLARVDRASGATDLAWTSAADNWVLDLHAYKSSIFVTGWFTSMGGQARQGVARLPVAGDTIFIDDYDG